MESSYRLKIKIGPHEFEAEGNPEVVQEQFRIFKELIVATPTSATPQTQSGTPSDPSATQTPAVKPDMVLAEVPLNKITKVDGRVISLTARPKTVDDAVLLLIYAQKTLRENDAVTGAELMDGITATGGMSIERVDKLLHKLSVVGDVIVIGERRAKRYRLTNTGLAKAKQIASDLVAIVA